MAPNIVPFPSARQNLLVRLRRRLAGSGSELAGLEMRRGGWPPSVFMCVCVCVCVRAQRLRSTPSFAVAIAASSLLELLFPRPRVSRRCFRRRIALYSA